MYLHHCAKILSCKLTLITAQRILPLQVGFKKFEKQVDSLSTIVSMQLIVELLLQALKVDGFGRLRCQGCEDVLELGLAQLPSEAHDFEKESLILFFVVHFV